MLSELIFTTTICRNRRGTKMYLTKYFKITIRPTNYVHKISKGSIPISQREDEDQMFQQQKICTYLQLNSLQKRCGNSVNILKKRKLENYNYFMCLSKRL